MTELFSPSFIKRFFYEIYKILKDTDKGASEIWYELSEIKILRKLDKLELSEFFDNFKFIEKKCGNYTDYISIDKIKFVAEAIKYLEIDIKELSELLDFNGFEALIQEILLRNDYRAIRNFRFSDKSDFKSKTSQSKYEIDVIGVYHNSFLIIDAKQWRRKDSFSLINKAANLQYQRVVALKNNPEAFSELLHKVLGININIKNFLPFKLLPVMVTIEYNGIKINENQIPLVSINNFNAFLQEYDKYLDYYKMIEINKVSIQKQLI
ncbi:MAG: hypothetical protein ACFFDO_05845 [Candidatus Thorarchaeota archaeon]